MKIWHILFGSNCNAKKKKKKKKKNGGKWMVNRLEKVQHVLYVVMIYYGFHNSILFVQFKRIIIDFISIVALQIVQCLFHTLFEKRMCIFEHYFQRRKGH